VYDDSIRWLPSPNFNSRQGKKIEMIVVHHTAIPTIDETIRLFLDTKSSVSSHYVLGRDGGIVQMVRDEDRAWHAGVSRWKGVDNCNDYSIGIEIVNRGDGSDPFSDEQYCSLSQLVGWLVSKYGIGRDMIVGHRDIALPPGRKVDPADNFDWSRLVKYADRSVVSKLADQMHREYREKVTGAAK
jgi:N-acetylmuramoyl-L-alanine amidase